MPKKDADVIVIGGGIIGTSIAYQLSKRGKKALIIEREDLCTGTSGSCDAYITPHTKKPGFHLGLCLESMKLYKELEEELGDELEYWQRGGFQPCEDELSFQLVSENAKDLMAGGLEVKMMDIDEFRRHEPNMSPNLVGALHCPSACQINPFKVVMSYARNLKKLGSGIMANTEVTDLLWEDRRVIGVKTDQGEFYADYVVNATGCWGAQIARMAGLEAPIEPRRGQIIVTEPTATVIDTTMQSGMYLVIKFHPEKITDERTKRLGSGFCIEQTGDGTILIGFTREFMGYDKSTTLEGIEYIISEGCKYLPCLRDMHVIRTFSGFRPFVADGLPLIGPVKGIPGFIMAAGHEGDGVALSPITGKLVAEMIVEGRPSFNIDAFSPNRFVEQE